MEEITIEDFIKIDLLVAKIIELNEVEDSDNLIQLKLYIVDIGTKTVFAGIKSAYKPDELLNKYVVCVNNLKPRKMRFGTSEGMILAAGDDDLGIYVLSPDEGALAGMKVR